MMRIGLTGGIGTGKSTVASRLIDRGVPVVDTDVIAKELVEPGTPLLREVSDHFGAEFLTEKGALDRGKLASVVFRDSQKLAELERILHPVIHQTWEAELSRRAEAGHALAVVVIPLLFEKGYSSSLDQVVCVGCTAATQRRRLQERGWSDEEREARLSRQWSNEAKMEAAHFVLWNEGSLELLDQQWTQVVSSLGLHKDSKSSSVQQG